MGLFFTIVYIITAIITPTAIFGSLAEYHVEVILATLAFLFSLGPALESGAMRMPQTYALLGLTFAVALSMLFAGLTREIPSTLVDFIPAIAAFFFILWNFKTKTHLQILVAALLVAALFIVFQGYTAQATGDSSSMYVIPMHNAEGDRIFRIRGLGIINDPNDFSQFVVGLIPCTFLFWKKGRALLNVLLVYFPISILLYGMYLTHSRGAMVALMASAMVAGRRKIGTVASVVGGLIVFAGLSATGWSGGRDVSAAAGADRTEAWATGLKLIRAHPIFGVGYLRFTEYFYITAHNSIVVCAAELGFFGFFFWVLLIFTTMHDMVDVTKGPVEPVPANTGDENREGLPAFDQNPVSPSQLTPAPIREEWSPIQRMELPLAPSAMVSSHAAGSQSFAYNPSVLDQPQEEGQISPAEVQRMGQLLIISFTGFLAAGWFLSRAYTIVFFVYVGIAAAIYRIAHHRGLTRRPISTGAIIKRSAVIAVVLILIVYVGLRLQSFSPN